MELEIHSDKQTASILQEEITQDPTGEVQFRFISRGGPDFPDSYQLPVEVDQGSRDQDSRHEFRYFDISHFFISLTIPATYVLKKILDPVLEEIGKSLVRYVKQVLKKRKTGREDTTFYLVIVIESTNYILPLNQNEVLLIEQRLSPALHATLSHWRSLSQQEITIELSPHIEPGTYRILIKEEDDHTSIEKFDPFH